VVPLSGPTALETGAPAAVAVGMHMASLRVGGAAGGGGGGEGAAAGGDAGSMEAAATEGSSVAR
jgi:hypothetical protein